MFSGIIEAVSQIANVTNHGTSKVLTILNPFKEPLYIDQSISHNGVCLTVVEIEDESYKVEVIEETLRRSNLDSLEISDEINLERSLLVSSRIDGHLVQGHVDCTGEIISIKDKEGSWEFNIQLPEDMLIYCVEKGSIAINGISLTISQVLDTTITVSIIPYTYQNTNLQHTYPGGFVNIEFDMIGKYIIGYMKKIKP